MSSRTVKPGPALRVWCARCPGNPSHFPFSRGDSRSSRPMSSSPLPLEPPRWDTSTAGVELGSALSSAGEPRRIRGRNRGGKVPAVSRAELGGTGAGGADLAAGKQKTRPFDCRPEPQPEGRASGLSTQSALFPAAVRLPRRPRIVPRARVGRLSTLRRSLSVCRRPRPPLPAVARCGSAGRGVASSTENNYTPGHGVCQGEISGSLTFSRRCALVLYLKWLTQSIPLPRKLVFVRLSHTTNMHPRVKAWSRGGEWASERAGRGDSDRLRGGRGGVRAGSGAAALTGFLRHPEGGGPKRRQAPARRRLPRAAPAGWILRGVAAIP